MSEKPSQPDSEAPRASLSALPQVDFSNFVLSLSATAMVQLGMVPDPESGNTVEPNRLIARHTIDTLEMIRDKTRGNLEPDEEQLIDSMLYELRMRFVEAGPVKPAAAR